MRFVAPASAIHAGPNHKYYGQERGVTWYNMISKQFSGLAGVVIPGTLRDSMVVLALLLEQETELDPLEIMTDTAAYSDAIFGLFWLLGYQFSPRPADIGGAKLWRIDRHAHYGPFDAIASGRININLIREQWPYLIRLAGSLKLGHLKAAGVMRMLQVKDRPTTLAKALFELGRIIKALHVLRFIDDRPFRRRILFQLNRQELRHKLGRRVHHGDRGEIRSPLRQGQEEQLGVLGLALNSIVHWNTVNHGLHVISGLPRAGSTLLSALVRQNPHVHAAMTSPVGSLVTALLRGMSQENEGAVFIDDDQRARILIAAVDAFYAEIQPDKVVIDTNRLWCSKLPTIAALWPGAKVIACVRNPAWCLDSIESLTRRNALEPSGTFKFDPGGTVYSRAEGLMSGTGMIGYALNALREAVFGAERDRLLLVRFEALTVDPARVLCWRRSTTSSANRRSPMTSSISSPTMM